MKKYLYAVIILNYASQEDSILAAKSVIDNANDDNYIICIADNGTSEKQEKLDDVDLKNTEVFKIKNNEGYGRGNNFAIEHLNKKYDFEYLVIMNPDVQIKSAGLIEELICEVERDKKYYAGAQPLVNTLSFDKPPEMQECIRRTLGIKGTIVYTSSLWKRLFSKCFRYITYSEERPYTAHCDFEVPCGAFFVIRKDIFKDIGYFDMDTFLYFEEFFIGYRLKQKELYFRLCPNLIVDHYQGKVTNARAGHFIPRHTNRYTVAAQKIYLKKCLKVPNVIVSVIGIYLICEYETIRLIKRMIFFGQRCMHMKGD